MARLVLIFCLSPSFLVVLLFVEFVVDDVLVSSPLFGKFCFFAASDLRETSFSLIGVFGVTLVGA